MKPKDKTIDSNDLIIDQTRLTTNYSQIQTPSNLEEGIGEIEDILNSNGISYDTTTQSEDYLLEKIISRFLNERITTNIVHGEWIFSKSKKVDQSSTRSRFSNLIPRRLDFYLPKFTLAIEVDGPAHDSFDHRSKRDNTRDHELKSHGIDLFRISNQDIYDDQALNRFLNDLANECKRREQDPQHYKLRAKTRKSLSRARQEHKKKNPNSQLASGSPTNKESKKFKTHKLLGEVKFHYCGRQYKIRSK